MKKFLSKIFKGVTVILLILSVAAMILIQIDLGRNYQFDLSVSGITYYLLAFGKFKELFLGTIALVAGYVGVESFLETVKENRYTDWVARTEIRYSEIVKYDPQLKILLSHQRRTMFEYLEKENFSFNNKESLKLFFEKFIAPKVPYIEESNTRYENLGGCYPDENFTFSYLNFQYIFAEMVNLSKSYPCILNDLHTMYIDSLPKNRTIDSALYNAAINDYCKSRCQQQ